MNVAFGFIRLWTFPFRSLAVNMCEHWSFPVTCVMTTTLYFFLILLLLYLILTVSKHF